MYGCDTFVVLPPLTKLNGFVFGKNSDRPHNEVQEIVYYPAKPNFGPGIQLKCTYIEIEETSDKTYAVILSKPTWMWGAEMGANSAGVVIGNEAIFTEVPEASSEKRLLGMDFVRLGLERGGTAEEALNTITSLLEKYGQGGPCSNTDHSLLYHNSYIIADSQEAWVLETVDYHWVGQKIKEGFRNISNCLSITTNIDKMSEGLFEYALGNNLWNGQDEFNFKEVFSSGSCSREVDGRKLLENSTRDHSFGVEDMFSILRDKKSGICRVLGQPFVTTSSQVSLLSENKSVHWFTGTPDPSQSIFKPFIFTSNVNFSNHTVSQEGEDTELYKLHGRAITNKRESLEKLREMEQICTSEVLQQYSQNDAVLSSCEFDALFKDVVETEVRFYK